jgi:hypothetical protein
VTLFINIKGGLISHVDNCKDCSSFWVDGMITMIRKGNVIIISILMGSK